MPDPVTKPVWSMESNAMWPSRDASVGWLVYRFHSVGISPTWVEWNLTKGASNAPTWDQYLNSDAAITIRTTYQTLEQELDITRMAPQHSLLTPGAVARCLAEPGQQYLVAASGAFSLDLPTGSYEELWIDWRSNARRGPTAFEWAGGARAYEPDGDFQVLIVRAEGVADTTPPTAPGDLVANAISDIRVDLSWSAAADAESGVVRYDVLRDGSPIGSTQSLAYIDDTVSAATTYDYRVRAVNGAGLVGPASAVASATTPAFNQPPTVTVSAPADGSSHHAGDPISIAASASDSDGEVVAVTILVINQGGGVGDVVLEQTDNDGSDGWSIVWTDPTVNDYDITATARDDQGKTTESAAIVLQVVNQDPTIDAISASPDPVTGTTTGLSVTASDPDGDPLSYQWIASTTPGGAQPDLVADAREPTVTFDVAGDYVFTCTVSDGHGGQVSDTVTVTVEQRAEALSISP